MKDNFEKMSTVNDIENLNDENLNTVVGGKQALANAAESEFLDSSGTECYSGDGKAQDAKGF